MMTASTVVENATNVDTVIANANFETRICHDDNGNMPISQSCCPSSDTSGNTNRLVNVARMKLSAPKFKNGITIPQPSSGFAPESLGTFTR